MQFVLAPRGQMRVKMLSLHKCILVVPLCGFIFCDLVMGTKAECPKTGQTTGAGSLCCNETSYDPGRNTCCTDKKSTKSYVTKGLSERMSQCCGLQAYNPLNEMCCKLAVKPKPSLNAGCCDKEPYDKNTKLCCGGKKLLTRLSPEHLCCFESQFDPSIEKCCQNTCPRIQLKINNSIECEKNLTCPGTSDGNGINTGGTNEQEQAPENDTDTVVEEVCCKSESEKEVYSKKDGFSCCGHHYYNCSLWSCEEERRLRPIDNPAQCKKN
ncbi:galaxin-like isoform X3 [Girardinichthys multiradiatus]|uniref:galaxin-like isoform X3 n=1 Tax=Girardinichthys multiradiatus TaxID=208333 RepID=UPI001FAC029A|nr:galaxin-like isoform X3 [Girardinichthys multiradiatus]XP_047246534.1 galaxin-like isoform X3 [Girardinichthys multiradiatus]